MLISRRDFLATFSATAAAGHHQMVHLPPVARPPKLIVPASLAPFVDPLFIPPVLKPSAEAAQHVPIYRVPIREFRAQVHRDVPATRFWGYADSLPGPTIEARSGEEVLIEWQNNLPREHFLPIDRNLMGAEKDKPEVRTAVHLHGAKVPPESDGYPEDWYTTGQSKRCRYPNRQEACMLWYHDHAMGINRLNICAGMFGSYVIRDAFEDGLNLPKGEFEISLLIADRFLAADGQLYYPISERAGAPWVPEFFGDAVLVNGKLFPYLDVQPRKYRFRLLNAANGRFFFLSLNNGQLIHLIGSDQGLLASPIQAKQMTIAPGERMDFVVDFADHAGEHVTLNDQATQILQFRVAKTKVPDPSSLPTSLRPIARMDPASAVRTRRLTLEEVDFLTGDPDVHLLDGKRWHEPVSERPVLDTTEIWELMNLTDDTHPIHLHLVRFQVLDRRPLNTGVYLYQKKLVYTGDAVPPEPHEMGWKDTVRATPGACTRIIVNFSGYPGRYVWHCHILEHEDNEMMRPFEVVSA